MKTTSKWMENNFNAIQPDFDITNKKHSPSNSLEYTLKLVNRAIIDNKKQKGSVKV